MCLVKFNYNRKEERESKRSWQPIYKDKEEKKLR